MSLFSKIRELFAGKTNVDDGNKETIGFFNANGSLSYSGKNYLNSQYMTCTDFLARHISMMKPYVQYKGEADKTMSNLNRILSLRPNPIQTASEFYYTIANSYFTENIALVQIVYNNYIPQYLFPIDTSTVKVSHLRDELYLTFIGADGKQTTLPATDMIILVRKPNSSNPLFTEDHSLDQVIRTINANYVGLENAIIQSHLLRFIVKWPSVNKKADELRKQYEDQIRSDTSGLIVLSNGEDFTPITSSAIYAKQPEMDDLTDQIYSYFGLNKNIIQSTMTDIWHHAMMENDVMPFVTAFKQEATYKLFTDRELGYGNEIMVDAEPIENASPETKQKAATILVSSGYYTPNQICNLLGLDKIKGGDELVHSLNFTTGTGGKPEQDGEKSAAVNNSNTNGGNGGNGGNSK